MGGFLFFKLRLAVVCKIINWYVLCGRNTQNTILCVPQDNFSSLSVAQAGQKVGHSWFGECCSCCWRSGLTVRKRGSSNYTGTSHFLNNVFAIRVGWGQGRARQEERSLVVDREGRKLEDVLAQVVGLIYSMYLQQCPVLPGCLCSHRRYVIQVTVFSYSSWWEALVDVVCHKLICTVL